MAGATLAFAAADAVAAEHPDAELLAACTHYGQLEAAYRASCDGDENVDLMCPDGYDEAIDAVISLPATTAEGMRAKARAAITYHQPNCNAGDAHALMWTAIHAAAAEYAA